MLWIYWYDQVLRFSGRFRSAGLYTYSSALQLIIISFSGPRYLKPVFHVRTSSLPLDYPFSRVQSFE